MRYLLFFSLVFLCACGSFSKSSDLRNARYIVTLNTQAVFGGEVARCVTDSLVLASDTLSQCFAFNDIAFIERPPNQMGRWVFGGLGLPLGALLGGITGLAIVSGDTESNPKAFIYSIVTGAIAGTVAGVALWERIDSDRLNVSSIPLPERKSRIESFIK
ncbi:MAG: hypothetical protein ACK4XY_03925 [Chloroherpetonaceae bacterium]